MKLEFLKPELDVNFTTPMAGEKVKAGIPGTADNYLDEMLNLNDYLVKHPAATCFVRASGNSMQNAGIFNDDILVVDRSVEPKNNSIVIALVDGEFTVKRVSKVSNKLYLLPENPTYKPIEITETMDFKIWGVVTFVVHKV